MFYKFLKISIGSAIKIFFRRIAVRGAENIPTDKPLILVSNHPSAFMDPLVLGVRMKRSLYFFARADIFNSPLGNWFMKKAHVSPIYRMVDGVDSLEKNDVVFAHAYELLSKNKTLLLFGEGFTDEEFIRRVKPMKKGSMRIALGAENKYDFNLGVNIVCAGINYSDPREFRSDLLISFSKPIDAKQYKDLFLQHPNKAMMELNKEVYSCLKEQVIHVENQEHSELFEQLLILTGKGFSHHFNNSSVSLEERWIFSKRLAEALNKKAAESPEEIKALSEKCKIVMEGGSEQWRSGSTFASSPFAFLAFPVFLFGMLHNYFPVKLATIISRKISKRPVFWSGTDMVFSLLTVPLYYALVAFFLSFAHLPVAYSFVYLIAMPLTGIFAYNYLKWLSGFLSGAASQKKSAADKQEKDKKQKLKNEICLTVEELLLQKTFNDKIT